ncbi:PhzF family phenazine biosynthesis protein [Jeotgalibacillus marinus]|uniref:PhzF family phenazine biosynthesis protein n=1 Tax=Jeotgalibacillus marinus TaxID=86667 RepID=A0ABV3Q516_9BACL
MIVTCQSNQKDIDFVSRCFYTNSKKNEDPVTGSAHCVLAPYWHKKTNKDKFLALQASKRSGRLVVELKEERSLIHGKAVTIMEGQFLFGTR